MTVSTQNGISADIENNTILIADDNADYLSIVAHFLQEAGFVIVTSRDGESVIAQATASQPALILLDVMMPGMDGFETCRRLKADDRTSHIPVIFMTALTDTVDKVKGFELGAVDYITKPVQKDEMIARLKAHITIRAMQTQLQAQNSNLREENVRRKRVQDALKESRERYRLLAENSTDIISRQTPQGIYRYVSPACQVVLGYKIEEMVGHSFYDFFHPDDLEKVRAEQAAQPERPSVETITYRARHKDGHYIWLETTNRLIRDAKSGMALEIIGVSRDVTDRKEAQEALRKARDELEIRVAARTAELAALNTAYERFVPHEFLRFLERDSIIDVQLGDQVQRVMTVLFSDIRSFTSLSEKMTPQENFNFINAFLGHVSPIIRRNGGFIDKYIGDAVMALFPNQAEDALQAAIAMQRGVLAYNQELQQSSHPPIQIGVGLHTGSLMLGTIGEAKRMESTVISDAVNLAARIEGLTKLYGAYVLISESVLFALNDPVKYTFRFLDRVKVKGKKEPVSVFEIFDGQSPETLELKLETLPNFERALLHYHSQEFEAAAAHFKQVLTLDPVDKAAQLYMQRIENFKKFGTPPNWEGVTALVD